MPARPARRAHRGTASPARGASAERAGRSAPGRSPAADSHPVLAGGRPAGRVAPEADAVAMHTHRNRRADVGDQHRVAIAVGGDEGLGRDLPRLQQPVVAGGRREAPPRAASWGSRASGASPVAAEGRAFACPNQSAAWAARSASSAKPRPGRKFPLTHFTSDSTLPFWLPAPGSQACGWKPNSAASWRRADVQIASPLASRPLVTVFMLSKTSTHGTQPSAARQATSPRKSVSWRISGEPDPGPATVLQAAGQEVARGRGLPGERELPHLAPIDLEVLRGQALEADRHVGRGLLLLLFEPHPADIPAKDALSAGIRPRGIGARQLQHPLRRQPLTQPARDLRPVGIDLRAAIPLAAWRSTGSCNTRLIVVGLRPNSAAIWRILLPRFARRWIVLRSICRNILSPSHSTGFYYGSGGV